MKVLVNILTYNSSEHILNCLTSLQKTTYQNYQVNIVDNASGDNTISLIKENFPELELIALSSNKGYGAGHNIALKKVSSAENYDFIALLNADLVVHPEWLSELVKIAQKNPQGALFGSLILSKDGSQVEFDGSTFDWQLAGGGYLNQEYKEKENDYKIPTLCGYVCGACMLIRLRALNELGFFDEDYFLYNEDVDLSLRAWLSGWQVWFVPSSKVFHCKGGSTKNDQAVFYLGHRNALTTQIKNYQLSTIKKNFTFLLNKYLFPTGFWWQKKLLWKALLYNLLKIPKILGKRKKVQKLRKHSDLETFLKI